MRASRRVSPSRTIRARAAACRSSWMRCSARQVALRGLIVASLGTCSVGAERRHRWSLSSAVDLPVPRSGPVTCAPAGRLRSVAMGELRDSRSWEVRWSAASANWARSPACSRAPGGEKAERSSYGVSRGVGNTSLLEQASAIAHGMVVLRTTGVDAESDLPFAGLYGLVRPVVEKLDQLFEPQAAALVGSAGGSRRRVIRIGFSYPPPCLACSLPSGGGSARSCVLIDDAQRLDRPSAGALVFTARRLRAERVAMVFGARDGEPLRFDAPGLPELLVSGVDEARRDDAP